MLQGDLLSEAAAGRLVPEAVAQVAISKQGYALTDKRGCSQGADASLAEPNHA